jgi:hypothetical protein
MNHRLLETLVSAATVKTAADPGLSRLLLAGGAGMLAGAVPTALIARAHEQAARQKARNVGFGAGVATGMSAPSIISTLHSMYGGNR